MSLKVGLSTGGGQYSQLEPDAAASKAGRVFQDLKEQQPTLESANLLLNKGFAAKDRKNAYDFYLKAKKEYASLPNDSAKIKGLIRANYNLAYAASDLRGQRRLGAGCIGFSGMVCLWPMICTALKFVLTAPEWIDNSTFRSYIDEGMELIAGYIETVESSNKITMNTTKSSVDVEVRKNLGWAYYMKGKFYELKDMWAKSGCLWDCCFDGKDGNTDFSEYDLSKSVSQYKLASEWDTSNEDYATSYQRADALLRTPIVKVKVETY